MPPSRRRVVVTQRFFDQATIDYLEQAGCEVVQADLPPGQADGNLSHDELVRHLAGAAGWIVGHARVTRELMAALPDLRIVSRRGVGYDRVDLAAAGDLGKVVCIAVGGNHESVADHTLALMLAVGHRFRETQARMIGGDWSILLGTDLYRKTVGVIGPGRIGRSVVQRLAGFEAEVLVHGGSPDAGYAARSGVTWVDLDELLVRSDYVTIHAPLTPETRFIIDAGALARMKPAAFLINTARGGLVDDAALLDALRNGVIAGAGLDVFLSEADPAFKPVTQALLELPNVIATPHSGASSREGLDRTNMVAARCVVAVLDGGDPPAECVVADGRKG
ncbi:phosphoglycerate dehydrogenase [Novosphingobium sp. MD-1]|uniref:phosphoglycerate dehydrogenase n=1 Tax=Novosphingobium sp. MD-1 TaxID=1630648 RepID=UPI00061BBA9D|nr:phosphoglycerate dehydrogenase [Novosphingobium sp. MD-1]GAO53296.1 D-3-phosphoglycerate dehydrogenase [Novosphingobium sp. MD-1]